MGGGAAARIEAGLKFRVGGAEIDWGRNEILGPGGRGSRLSDAAMSVLEHLVAHPGEVCGHDELLDAGWGDADRTPENLTKAVSDLRRALGESPRDPVHILTVPRRGYRYLPATPDPPTPAAPTVRPRPARSWLLAGAATVAVALIAGALLAGRMLDGETGTAAPVAAPLPAPAPRLLPVGTSDRYETTPAMSGDGRRVVYVREGNSPDSSDLVLRDLETGAEQTLATTEGVLYYAPAFAPDGTRVAVAAVGAGRCEIELRRLPSGTLDAPIAPCVPWMLPTLDWGPDDRIVIGTMDGAEAAGLYSLRPGSSALVPLTAAPARSYDVFPRHAPGADGRLAFARVSMDQSTFELRTLSGGREDHFGRFAGQPLGLEWLPGPTPRLLVAIASAGEPRLHVASEDGSLVPTDIAPAKFPRLAGSDLVYVASERDQDIALFALTGAGDTVSAERLTVIGSSEREYLPAFDPTGRRLAFVSTRSGEPAVWLRHLDDGTEFLLASGAGAEIGALTWAGDRLVLRLQRGGRGELALLDVGRRTLRPIFSELEGAGRIAWDAAADRLIFECYFDEHWRLCGGDLRSPGWREIDARGSTPLAASGGGLVAIRPGGLAGPLGGQDDEGWLVPIASIRNFVPFADGYLYVAGSDLRFASELRFSRTAGQWLTLAQLGYYDFTARGLALAPGENLLAVPEITYAKENIVVARGFRLP